jgi:hypothetical protein
MQLSASCIPSITCMLCTSAQCGSWQYTRLVQASASSTTRKLHTNLLCLLVDAVQHLLQRSRCGALQKQQQQRQMTISAV